MSAPKDAFPVIPQDLLLALEKRFPNVCPPIGQGADQLLLRQGEQTVVQLLRHHFDRQNKSVLTGT